MNDINIINLNFSYGAEEVFKNLNLTLNTSWKTGLTGKNGKGKTTLLKLIEKRGEFADYPVSAPPAAYYPFEVNEKLPVINALTAAVPFSEEWAVIRELSLLKVPENAYYRPFQTLSGGEKTKALIAALFAADPEFILIDEPTNHLDEDGRLCLARYLKKRSEGYIIVSHDRKFLDICTDHTVSLNKSDVSVCRGNFSDWWNLKLATEANEELANKKLSANISRLKNTANKARGWAADVEKSKKGEDAGPDSGFIGHKSAKMMKRAKTIENRVNKTIEQKSELLKNAERTDEIKLHPLNHFADVLIRLENVNIFYGETTAAKDVNLTITQGDKLALSGGNGCGKSTVLKLLTGENLRFTGFMQKASGLKISYVPQDCSNIFKSPNEIAAENNLNKTLFFTLLVKMGLQQNKFVENSANFSDGQKKKLLLAASLSMSAHLYVWDEPLNYLDIFSRMQIENLLKESRAMVIFVEHDATFRENVGARTIKLK